MVGVPVGTRGFLGSELGSGGGGGGILGGGGGILPVLAGGREVGGGGALRTTLSVLIGLLLALVPLVEGFLPSNELK